MKLVMPSQKYYQSYMDAAAEYRAHNVTSYHFLDKCGCGPFEYIDNSRTGSNLPAGYVKATYLWLVDANEFIGEVSIRHELTDALLRFGGNIGYGIRYSHWNRGLGTMMLSEALDYAQNELSLNRVLVTCNESNAGSARVIEKNGGILQDKITNVIDGVERLTRRYWIELT